MAYKHVLDCPIDNTRLEDVISSHSGEETYHCLPCNTYWHVAWEKHLPINSKRYKWRVKYIRDDFGKAYKYIYSI